MNKITLMSPTTRAELLQRTTDPAGRAALEAVGTTQPSPRLIVTMPLDRAAFDAVIAGQTKLTTRLIRHWSDAKSVTLTHRHRRMMRPIKSAMTADGLTEIELESF